MPKYQAQHTFQLGDYWLSKQSRSPSWCRTWFDTERRQTCRVSLRTTDFEEAKQRLTDWFILYNTKSTEKPSEALLSEIFARYYEQYGSNLRTADSVQRALSDWLDFHQTATVQEACAMPQQHAFQKYLLETRGVAPNTARRIITIGKAALNWAWKRNEIEALPYIELIKRKAAPPKGRPLEIEEVQALLKHAEPHLREFIIMMIATTARTKAVLEITFDQIDFKNDIIHLNQAERDQTNKFRPTVKLPSSIKPWLLQKKIDTQTPNVISYREAPVLSIRSAWRSLRAELELDDQVQPYSIRHTMARWLRMSSVPAWEVAAQLGHKMPDVTTTEIYAPFDPAYLSKSVQAIDEYILRVNCV